MSMRFSLHGSIQHVSQAIERAREAEALGYEGMFVADGQMTCLDSFQTLALCALQTKRLLLGTAGAQSVNSRGQSWVN